MNYKSLLAQYEALLTGRWLTDLANTSAFLMMEIQRLNWVGFYLLEGEKLYLGPFQGKPACTEILLGRGVCGRAAEEKKTFVVDDVNKFEDHIVCDAASQSELVVPIIFEDRVLGVLDVDSQDLKRFGLAEKEFFEAVVKTFLEKIKSQASAGPKY